MVYCSTCDGAWAADLERLAAERGPEFSLMDRHPPCRAEGCGGRVFFRAAPGPGTPSIKLVTDNRSKRRR
jgi:hypothetical protein